MALFTDTAASLEEHDLLSLRAQTAGNVFERDDIGYVEALRGWNSAITQRPALIVQAHTAQDVARAIAFARNHALPL